MEFDSPDAKEFPGLYLADSGKADDSMDYGDDGEKKKSKKEKKKDKDKGYSALAAESSQDEEELDPKSPGKGMKIKAFSKLSGKKKEKDKDKDKSKDKELKKAEKEAKEKRKSEEKERKSMEKELTPGPASIPRPQIPFSGVHYMKTNSNQSAVLTPQSSLDMGTPVKRNILMSSSAGDTGGVKEKESTPAKPAKEKSAGFNVFLNAPAPLLSKLKDKDKDHSKDKEKKKDRKEKDKDKEKKHKDKEKGEGKSKKEKDREPKEKEKKEHSHASGMAKVKLKLMRSKNSLDDTGDLPIVSSSRQFPEDPEELAKEIRKYEGLLEQAHLSLKSSKKISKKQEEQLWELQRTLTQLKRKLRSINALSSAPAYHIHAHSSDRGTSQEQSVSPPPRPVFKKCDSIDGGPQRAPKLSDSITNQNGASSLASDRPSAAVSIPPKDAEIAAAPVPLPVTTHSAPQDIPKLPLPPSKNSYPKASEPLAYSTTSPVPAPVVPVPLAKSPPQAQAFQQSDASSIPPAMPVAVAGSAPTLESAKGTWTAEAAALSPPPGSAGVNVPEQNYIMTSPRPSVDTVVQVHCSSVERSDSDGGVGRLQDFDDDGEDGGQDEYLQRGSLSNDSSSHEGSKESIEQVLDDANKMIGSMHEELMFDTALDLVSASDSRMKNGLLSDPARRFIGQDDSDVELFTNDLELDPEHNLPNEEPCPDPFQMPVFDNAEYLSIENEALSLFNEQLQEDVKKDRIELEEMIQKMTLKLQNEMDSSKAAESEEDEDISDLAKLWSQLKSENEVLWDNVNRLRLAVAACKVDEFRLQTRLNYIETKASALSPVTTTTPLQTEA